MQDDTAFRSQEFANQVEERRDRISQTQIGLNLQAGELSNRFIQAQRQEQQFQMEQTMQASQLSRDELVRQQAQAEIDWAQKLHTIKFLENAQKRDQAATEVAVLQAKREKDKLGLMDPDLFTTEESRLNLAVSGVAPDYSHEAGGFLWPKTPAPQDYRDKAQARLDQIEQRRIEARYGRRTTDPATRRSQLMRDLDRAFMMDVPDEKLIASIQEELKQYGGSGSLDEVVEPTPPPLAVATKKRIPSIPGFGKGNTEKAIDFLSQPAEIEALRGALRRKVSKERQSTFNPTDEEVIDIVVNILRNTKDPRRKPMMQYLHMNGSFDPAEAQDAESREGFQMLRPEDLAPNRSR